MLADLRGATLSSPGSRHLPIGVRKRFEHRRQGQSYYGTPTPIVQQALPNDSSTGTAFLGLPPEMDVDDNEQDRARRRQHILNCPSWIDIDGRGGAGILNQAEGGSTNGEYEEDGSNSTVDLAAPSQAPNTPARKGRPATTTSSTSTHESSPAQPTSSASHHSSPSDPPVPSEQQPPLFLTSQTPEPAVRPAADCTPAQEAVESIFLTRQWLYRLLFPAGNDTPAPH